MMDSINGTATAGPMEQVRDNMTKNAPPSAAPAGAPAVEPDVAVAISEMAQARMDSMMAAPAEAQKGNAAYNGTTGGMDFGVDKGGFDWPLDAKQSSTASVAEFESQGGWEAAGQSVNGVLLDEASAAEYIALGKTSISENA